MHPLDLERAITRSRLRVRFCETDLMGIVHHSNYLAYFEAGRVEWLRRRGVTYADWAARGMHLPVVEASVRYRAPARFDDVLAIETRLVELRAASLRFEYRMERDGVGVGTSRGSSWPKGSRASPASTSTTPSSAFRPTCWPPWGLRRWRQRGTRSGSVMVDSAPMLRGLSLVFIALLAVGLSACGHGGSARLEGKWKGKSAEGVAPEAQSAANAFAVDTEIDVKGDAITVITPRDKQTGTYRVVKEDRAQVTIVTDKDGPDDAQTFTLLDEKTLRWSVLDGKTITFVREK